MRTQTEVQQLGGCVPDVSGVPLFPPLGPAGP